MKCCSVCKIELNSEHFYKRKTSRDGLRSECISCSKLAIKKSREKIKEKNKKTKIFDIENKNKLCKKCGEVKSFVDFVKNKSKKLGIDSYCKECHKVMSNAHKYKKFNQYMEEIRNGQQINENGN